MTKQEEIKILQSLKGGTYFSQSVGGDDIIDMMIDNINKDFDLFCGTPHDIEVSSLKKLVESVKAECKSEIQSSRAMYDSNMDVFCEELLQLGERELCDGIYKYVAEKWGVDKVIRFKIDNGVELETEELQLMYERAFPNLNQTLIA